MLTCIALPRNCLDSSVHVSFTQRSIWGNTVGVSDGGVFNGRSSPHGKRPTLTSALFKFCVCSSLQKDASNERCRNLPHVMPPSHSLVENSINSTSGLALLLRGVVERRMCLIVAGFLAFCTSPVGWHAFLTLRFTIIRQTICLPLLEVSDEHVCVIEMLKSPQNMQPNLWINCFFKGPLQCVICRLILLLLCNANISSNNTSMLQLFRGQLAGKFCFLNGS